MSRILAVDDEADILSLIQNVLEQHGYIVDTYMDPTQIPKEQLNRYDLILLDIMMPGEDGVTFCKEIRSMVDCPVLFLTAKVMEPDIVEGFSAGGDDYITKPFGTEELAARVQAHLRREQREKHSILNTAEIRFDLSSKEIFVHENAVPVTKSEYEICEYLARHRGQVFSREQIYDAVFGYEGESDSSVISEHVKNIRAKFLILEQAPVSTVWGIGYKWL